MPSMICCINGRFVDTAKATVSVLDNGFLYGDGFYDTMRVYDGVVFELELHLKRIEKSARTMGFTLPHDPETIGRWIRELIEKNKLKSARVRVTMTRGTHGIIFDDEAHPTIAITCESLRHDFGIYTKGVSVCTMHLQRAWPSIKTIGLAGMILASRRAKREKFYEVLCIGDGGMVREGAFTNIFVVKNGRLLTPRTGMLAGQTRHRVLALARTMGLKIVVKDFRISRLRSADEIFVTNSVREIVPVMRLNTKKVGTGKPGSVTKRLMEAYGEYVRLYVGREKKRLR